jgi:hypothetical protein
VAILNTAAKVTSGGRVRTKASVEKRSEPKTSAKREVFSYDAPSGKYRWKCNNCSKYGHFARECPQPKKTVEVLTTTYRMSSDVCDTCGSRGCECCNDDSAVCLSGARVHSSLLPLLVLVDGRCS